jgi:hypothetical protein
MTKKYVYFVSYVAARRVFLIRKSWHGHTVLSLIEKIESADGFKNMHDFLSEEIINKDRYVKIVVITNFILLREEDNDKVD